MNSKNKTGIIPTVVLIIILIVGLSVMLYPTVSNWWNERVQSQAIAEYDKTIQNIDQNRYDEIWANAEEYNKKLSELYAPFSNADEIDGYDNILDVSGTGIMGYITIPVIKVEIPIYHGTSDSVLQRAAGHLSGTRLPIGGEGNHSVLAAHRGLPSARLFTDLDQIEIGDKFYIHILDEVLAYQVDQISDMIDKDDTDTLTSLMQMEDGEDYVTLLTCTPYGINSHRLLVRGTRVPYEGEEEVAAEPPLETMVKSVQNYYMLYLMFFAGIILAIAIISKVILFFMRKKNKKPKEGE